MASPQKDSRDGKVEDLLAILGAAGRGLTVKRGGLDNVDAKNLHKIRSDIEKAVDEMVKGAEDFEIAGLCAAGGGWRGRRRGRVEDFEVCRMYKFFQNII